MENDKKLKLIENIINDKELRNHNKVTYVEMLFDNWNTGKYKEFVEHMEKEYFKEL